MTQVDQSPIEDILPLTGLQEAMIYHSTAAHAERERDPYLIVAELDLTPLIGEVDDHRLGAAVATVVARHAALRTSYTRRRTGAPVARVHRAVDPGWQVRSATGVDGLVGIREELRHSGIDLAAPGPTRWILVHRRDVDGDGVNADVEPGGADAVDPRTPSRCRW